MGIRRRYVLFDIGVGIHFEAGSSSSTTEAPRDGETFKHSA